VIIENYNLKRYALTLKILLGFFSASALMIILLGWRLSIGPIALDWAGEYLKQALASYQEDVNVDFRDAVLIWQKEERSSYAGASGLEIIFYEVEIKNRTTNFTLNVPEVSARFSGLAMLRGLLAPTNVSITGLSIDYTLGPDVWESKDDRPFMEKLEAFLRNIQNSNSLPFKMAQQLLSPPQSSRMAGYLRQVSLLDTKITLNDQLSGQQWQIPSAQLNLQRTDSGLSVNLSGDINMATSRIMPIDFYLLFDNDKKEAITTLEFSDLRPSALAGSVAALSGLADMDVPSKGNIEFKIDQNFNIPVVAFNLSLGEGLINPGKIYPEPLKITSAALNGHIVKKESSIVLDEISLQLGQTYVSGSGLLYGSTDRPGIAIKADIRDLPFLDLKTYWPGQFGKGAYKWIAKNIDGGIVQEGQLDIYIEPEMWPAVPDENIPAKLVLPPDVMVFKFDFNNINAHYLRPMPMLTGIGGRAVLNLHTFHLIASNGKIDQLTVKKADLLFSDIHIKGKGIAQITLDMEGTVEEILRVIDYKPLGYPTKYGIKQGSITGQAKATLSLQFPLLKKISLRDVTFKVSADIDTLSIPKLTESLAINDGRMHMFVDGKGIMSEGEIILNGVKLKTKWLENFNKEEKLPTKYVINGLIEGAEWEQLHLPFDPYIEGPVEIDLSLFGKGGTIVKGSGQFDLMNSKSIFAPIGWQKEKGKAGLVDFDLLFDGPGRINIRNIALYSETLRADLEIDMVDEWVTRFFIPKLVMKDTDIVMLMEWNAQKKYYLSSLTGKSFDAAPLIEIMLSNGGDEEKISLPDFNLEAEVDDLLTNNNVHIKETNMAAIYRAQDFTHITFDGKLAEDKFIKVTVKPEGDNRKLEFTSNDAGQALRGLGMFNIGIGGDMKVVADMVKHERGISLGGHAEAKKFKVIDTPEFSKLLAEKKFKKAQEELKRGGLVFNTFSMEFRTYNGVMEITKGRARGSSLGITMEGAVDQAYDEMSISGTLIPAYGLNSFLGNIPLIGTLLTGGKGQGIFAATYSISGPLDDPTIKINPLAALAPGIFRSLFSAIGGSKKKTLREQAEEMQKIIPNTQPAQKNKKPKK